MYDIVAIGSVTEDNFFELDYEVIDWPKTPLRKAIVFPLGEKMEVRSITKTLGGNAANASVTFSRQGFKTACFGKVGKDLAGKAVEEWLKKDKVKPLLVVSKTVPTASSALLLKDGERTILGYHGASNTLVAEDLPWRNFKSRWWYLSLAGESDQFLKPLLEFAKKNKIKVGFNPSGHHISHRREEVIAALPSIDFLVLNAGEAAELTGISFEQEKEVFKKLDTLVPGIVAVTDGPHGVTVSDGTHLYKAGIFPERKLVDRTGAGDAFGSGFVAGLMHAEKRSKITSYTTADIEFAIRLASANATAVVEVIGGTPGILSKEEFQNRPDFAHLAIQTSSL